MASIVSLMDEGPPRSLTRRRWLAPTLLAAVAVSLWMLLSRHSAPGAGISSTLRRLATTIAALPAGPVLAALTYAVAGVLFIRVTLLATTILIVFGLWPGIAVAWTGSMLSAVLSHAIGRWLGPRGVAWLPSSIQKGLRALIARHPLWTVMIMRLSPVGNFGALNLLAGAFDLPRRSFVLGNALGLLPGLLGLALVVDRAQATIRHPSVANGLTTAAALAVVVVAGIVVNRRLRD